MAAVKTEVIVLRTRRFSESSLIATLFGRRGGRLDVLAKGCRREKSPLFGHLELYRREEAVILERPQAGLNLFLEAACLDEHTGLRFFPPAFAAAGLLADLAAEAVQPGDSQPELFDTLDQSLRILSDLGEAPARAGLSPALPFSPSEKRTLIGRTLKLAMLEMLGWLGFGLELKRCVGCGREPPPGEPVWIGRRQGGLLCRGCRRGSGRTMAIERQALCSLTEREEGAAGLELALSEGDRKRLLLFLIDYTHAKLEKPLRSARAAIRILDGPSPAGKDGTRRG